MMAEQELALVTGGAGFIGSHTVDALVARGFRVRVLDSLAPRIHPHGPPSYLPAGVELVRGDVTSPADMRAALEGVAVVFHLAAYQDYLPDFSTFFHTNTAGTALLYEVIVAERLPVRKVVVASSQAVYGEGRHVCADHGDVFPGIRGERQLSGGVWDLACPECGRTVAWAATDERTVNPQNQYAISKYAQELVAINLGRRYDIPTVALRYSIVQGPRQSFFNAYSGACRIFCLSQYFGKAPAVYEDGRQVRDFVNIHDVVAANLLALESSDADFEVFNVGGGRAYTITEFAEIVAREFGAASWGEIPGVYRFGDTRHIVSDVSRLRALGWEPLRTPADSVAEYAEWLRGHDMRSDILTYAEGHMRQLDVLRSVQA